MSRRRTNLALGILTAITVLSLGGVFAISMSRGRAGAPSAEPTTTTSTSSPSTTTSVPLTTSTTNPLRIEETGPQFEWATPVTLDPDEIVVNYLEHQESTFLFTTRTGGGLDTRVSGDGLEWTSGQAVSTNFQPHSVVSTDLGLIAVGVDSSTGDVVAWRSNDGAGWESSVVTRSTTDTRVEIRPPVIADGVVLLQGDQVDRPRSGGNLEERVRAAVESQYGDSYVSISWSFDQSGEVMVTLFGPLGVPLVNFTPREIGMTDADFVPEPGGDSRATAWISTDGTTWRELTNIDWALVFNTYRGSDGRIWIADHGRNGVYASSDGTDWERVGDISTSGQVSEVTRQTWGLIGYGATPPGVAVSDDGQTWRTITVAGVLGRTPGVLWVPDTWAAGPGGFGIIVRPDRITFPGPGQPNQPLATHTEGDHRIEVYIDEIRILRDGTTLTSIDRIGRAPDDPKARYAEGVLTILDGSGEPLVVLGPDAITDLERVLSARREPRALLFTAAANWPEPYAIQPLHLPQNWTVQDLSSVTDGEILGVWVASDRVAVAAFGPDGTKLLVGAIPGSP